MRRANTPPEAAPAPEIRTLADLQAALVGLNIGQANELLAAYPDLAQQLEQARQRENRAREQQEQHARALEAAEIQRRVIAVYGNDRDGVIDAPRLGDNVHDAWITMDIEGEMRIHVRYNDRGGILFASAGEHNRGRYHITQRALIAQIRIALRLGGEDQRRDRGRDRRQDDEDGRGRGRSRSRSRSPDHRGRDYRRDGERRQDDRDDRRGDRNRDRHRHRHANPDDRRGDERRDRSRSPRERSISRSRDRDDRRNRRRSRSPSPRDRRRGESPRGRDRYR
jgi:hypothetical protein